MRSKMSMMYTLVLVLVFALTVAACGGGGEEPTPTPGAAAPEPTVIEIEADANLLAFKQKEIQVQAGQQVTVRFINPSTVFQHNWVLVNGGEDVAKAIDELALEAGPDKGYLPDDPRVLAAVPLVDPGQTGEVTFTAPQEPGEYLYICTFPGHYAGGMVGVLKVVP